MAVISELKTRSKNLLDYVHFSTYSNWDDSLVTSGSTTTNSSNYGYLLPAEVGKTYTLSYKTNSEDVFPTFLYLCKAVNGEGSLVVYLTTSRIFHETYTFTVNENEIYFLRMGSTGNLTGFNGQLEKLKYIQLEEGDTASTYQPYGYIDITKYNNATISNITYNGTDYHFAKQNEVYSTCDNAVEEPIVNMKISGNSVQDGTPTPEVPIEVESVGDKTKNLVNFFDINAQQFIINRNNKDIYGYLIPTIAGKTYTTSFTLKDPSVFIKYIYISRAKPNGEDYSAVNYITGTKPSSAILKFTAEEGYIYFIFAVNSSSGFTQSIIDTFATLQVEEGEVPTEYEPYGYKVPVKVTKGSLIPFETFKNANNWVKNPSSTTSSYYYLDDILEVGKTYTISYSYSELPEYFYINKSTDNFATQTTTYLTTSIEQNNPYTFTVEEGTRYRFFKYPNTQVQFDRFTDFRLDEGNSVAQPTTTNIYLSEPLRKIGNYADYIDYKNKKVVRKIVKKVFDGTEYIGTLTTPPYPYDFYPLGKSGVVVNDICLCTHFEHQADFSYTREGNNKFRVLNSTANDQARIVFRFYLNGEIVQEANSVKALLAEYYNTENPIKVYYAHADGLETEETIDIPEISTSKGTNNFTSETTILPSELKINYWKQIGLGEDEEQIIQKGSNLLIIKTGADITQSGSNLTIGE